MMTQFYIRYHFVTLTSEPAPGDRVLEDAVNYGPFASEAQAQQWATDRLPGRPVTIAAEKPLPGMQSCPACALSVWPDDEHPHGLD